MKTNRLIAIILLILISCAKKEKNTIEIKTTVNKTSEPIQVSSKTTDTLIINNKSAVIFEPTENSINKRKKEIGEEVFYIGADDYLFYLDQSITFLEKQEINIVQTKNNRILKFISEDKSEIIINLNSEEQIWGIYLFDPKWKPKKIDMTATEEEFKEYLK